MPFLLYLLEFNIVFTSTGLLTADNHFLNNVSRWSIPAFNNCFYTKLIRIISCNLDWCTLTIWYIVLSHDLNWLFSIASTPSFNLPIAFKYGNTLFSSGLWNTLCQSRLFCVNTQPFSIPFQYICLFFTWHIQTIHNILGCPQGRINIYCDRNFCKWIIVQFGKKRGLLYILFASFVKFCVDLWMGKIEASSFSNLPSKESKMVTYCARSYEWDDFRWML